MASRGQIDRAHAAELKFWRDRSARGEIMRLHRVSDQGTELRARITELERQLRCVKDDYQRAIESSCFCPSCGESFETTDSISLKRRVANLERERDELHLACVKLRSSVLAGVANVLDDKGHPVAAGLVREIRDE